MVLAPSAAAININTKLFHNLYLSSNVCKGLIDSCIGIFNAARY